MSVRSGTRTTSTAMPKKRKQPDRMAEFSFTDRDRLLQAKKGRSSSKPLGELFNSSKSLLWGVPISVVETAEIKLGRLARLHAGKSEPRTSDHVYFDWFQNDDLEDTPVIAKLCCAQGLAAILPKWMAFTDLEKWNGFLDQIQSYAAQHLDNEDRLLGQMANEVLATLGYQFGKFNDAEGVLHSASQRWLCGLQEMLDSDGAIQSRYSFWQPSFLATWTRVRLMVTQNAFLEAPEMAETWEWFVRFSLRLLRKDGTCLLANPNLKFERPLYEAAISTSSDREDRAIAKQVLSLDTSQKKRGQPLTEVGVFSEWAGVGVMQRDWAPDSPRLAVSIHEETMHVECARAVSLCSIEQLPDISLNGKILSPVGGWEEVATLFDEDLDYIEMEMQLEEAVRLQRQLIFLHGSNVWMIADGLFSEVEQRLDYQSRIRVASGISHFQETENQEIYLQQKKICGLILPLALSEWKRTDDTNLLTSGENHVILRQANYGKTLYAPLMLVADPKASLKPRTWRRLTVGEKLKIVDDDVARAYRVRIGAQQWVIYKSFAEPANRTFLGENHHCDFFMGRFEQDGSVEELIALDR